MRYPKQVPAHGCKAKCERYGWAVDVRAILMPTRPEMPAEDATAGPGEVARRLHLREMHVGLCGRILLETDFQLIPHLHNFMGMKSHLSKYSGFQPDSKNSRGNSRRSGLRQPKHEHFLTAVLPCLASRTGTEMSCHAAAKGDQTPSSWPTS